MKYRKTHWHRFQLCQKSFANKDLDKGQRHIARAYYVHSRLIWHIIILFLNMHFLQTKIYWKQVIGRQKTISALSVIEDCLFGQLVNCQVAQKCHQLSRAIEMIAARDYWEQIAVQFTRCNLLVRLICNNCQLPTVTITAKLFRTKHFTAAPLAASITG